MVESFLTSVAPNDVWIEDRNFCTTKLIFGIARRQAFFIVRQHSQSLRWRPVGEFGAEVTTADGTVAEQEITVENESGERLSVCRVRIVLTHPTRDGDRVLYLPTNLPAGVLAAIIAQVYRSRWQIETAFREATVDLLCEVPAWGHPQAAILIFAVATLCFHTFSVLNAALRTQLPADTAPRQNDQQGSETASLPQADIPLPGPPDTPTKIRVTRRELGDELSTYQLAENVAGTWQGLNLLLPDDFWNERFENLTATELASELRNLAQRVPLAEFRKRPTTAQRSPTRKPPKPGGHVATARLLNPAIHRE